ncbi:ABC transporter substrate-binding protein [Pokkaliibacter sp. MBI-7]|uniref:ABC transporter substrate-binding protein n=1 Tax=Pokkaliibacter sp. MBI-7 TaxID=3040600 RepID=UPI00244C6121|nr:ABC transporter substrate-binding protein [Pokkaliibacter sp. MBI-7]MDH2436546.1 ABC transporter substrate-binding protein [Pokkaliibacter sp. MBI-7]
MHKKTSLALAILLAAGVAAPVMAAKVPAGTELAAKQEIVFNNGAEPATLDPQKMEGTPESRIARNLFEGLVIQDDKGNILPGVATSWDVNDNNTVFTFHLRDDAKWSNGDPVTAGDFVFAWQRAVDPKTASPYSWYIEMTTMANASDIINGKKSPDQLGVKALDDHTLQVVLDKPIPYFIRMLGHTTMVPANKKVIDQWGEKWTSPDHFVGNGAYTLTDWVVNERIVLKRNPNYWDNKDTVVNQITVLPIESENSELSRYKAGEIDITNGSTPIAIEHFRQLKKDIPDQIHTTGQVGTYYYSFNNKKAPFDDARIRKALSFAIDRDVITDKITGQGEIPAYAFVPDITAGFTPVVPAWAKLTQKERVEEAKKLMKEAGYGPDHPLSFELLYNTSDNHKKIAIAVAAMWKQSLGVNVSLVNQEWKTYLATERAGDFQVARAGWVGDYNEASTMLDLLTTKNGNNYARYSNPEYDMLMADSKSVVDETKRNEMYNKAATLLDRDMPVAPIYQYSTTRLVKPYIGGYPAANPEDIFYFKDMYVAKH